MNFPFSPRLMFNLQPVRMIAPRISTDSPGCRRDDGSARAFGECPQPELQRQAMRTDRGERRAVPEIQPKAKVHSLSLFAASYRQWPFISLVQRGGISCFGGFLVVQQRPQTSTFPCCCHWAVGTKTGDSSRCLSYAFCPYKVQACSFC